MPHDVQMEYTRVLRRMLDMVKLVVFLFSFCGNFRVNEKRKGESKRKTFERILCVWCGLLGEWIHRLIMSENGDV